MKQEQEIFDAYHKWYFETERQVQTKWRGIPCLKSVCDLWNYQEIIFEMDACIIVEFGTYCGGSTLFFADLFRAMCEPQTAYKHRKILGVDTAMGNITQLARESEYIELMECSSSDPKVSNRISEIRQQYPGKMFAILDSLHTRDHVLAELENLRTVTRTGDYVIVEDSNLGGHPVCSEWGDNGPYDAREEYFKHYPNDYIYDIEREKKFGFTFSTRGFLKRQ